MNLLHELSPGSDIPNVINVVVEIVKGSRNKYEYSKEAGVFKLDRVLYSPFVYPAEYGFVPQTHYDDGDPLDVLVMMNLPTFPGCVIEARPLGMLRMIDSGEADSKILAVPATTPTSTTINRWQTSRRTTCARSNTSSKPTRHSRTRSPKHRAGPNATRRWPTS